MEVFGVHIFGSDATQWLALCKDQKKEWILKYTNQKDESLINDFVNNPNITKECKCLDCGKNKKDGISKSIPTEFTESIESTDASGDSKRVVSKRRKNDKTT